MEGYEIERLQADDWERFYAIRIRALTEAPDAFGSTLEETQSRPVGHWRERLEESSSATFVACEQASDVGLVVGAPFWGEEREGAAGLYSMWVAPEARGRGIGSALVSTVSSWAQTLGYMDIYLDVADENAPAIALYESQGFVPTGAVSTLDPPREHITEHERVLNLRVRRDA